MSRTLNQQKQMNAPLTPTQTKRLLAQITQSFSPSTLTESQADWLISNPLMISDLLNNGLKKLLNPRTEPDLNSKLFLLMTGISRELSRICEIDKVDFGRNTPPHIQLSTIKSILTFIQEYLEEKRDFCHTNPQIDLTPFGYVLTDKTYSGENRPNSFSDLKAIPINDFLEMGIKKPCGVLTAQYVEQNLHSIPKKWCPEKNHFLVFPGSMWVKTTRKSLYCTICPNHSGCLRLTTKEISELKHSYAVVVCQN